MKLPIPDFLRRFGTAAAALWIGRRIATERWVERREICVSTFTPGQLATFGLLGMRMAGPN